MKRDIRKNADGDFTDADGLGPPKPGDEFEMDGKTWVVTSAGPDGPVAEISFQTPTMDPAKTAAFSEWMKQHATTAPGKAQLIRGYVSNLRA